MDEVGVTYSQSDYHNFFPSGVAVEGGPSCCIMFDLVELVGLLVEPK